MNRYVDKRQGWRQFRTDWAATVARMRQSVGIEHGGVNDEWSTVQTLRHLVFVHARGRSLRQCLGTVLGEEFEHHRFCVRDLDLIERSTAG